MNNPKSFELLVDALSEYIRKGKTCISFSDLDLDIQAEIAANYMMEEQYPLDFIVDDEVITDLPRLMFEVMAVKWKGEEEFQDRKEMVVGTMMNKCIDKTKKMLGELKDEGLLWRAYSIATENDQNRRQTWEDDLSRDLQYGD